VHRGKRDIPANKDFWSSWNYASDNGRNYRCTYWLIPLQNTKDELFATMHSADYNPEYKEKLWVFDHPSYDVNTQKCVDYINKYNSHRRVHRDYGFVVHIWDMIHEYGIASAKRIIQTITGNKEYKPFQPSSNNRSMFTIVLDIISIKLLLFFCFDPLFVKEICIFGFQIMTRIQ
jgi:predicted NAD/FAD-binding protein